MKKPLVIIIVSLLLVTAVMIYLNMNALDEKITALSEFKTTEMHEAAEVGELEKVKQLVENGADLDAMDHYGKSALMNAVAYDRVELARWLLSQGAKMNYEYRREETAAKREELDAEYKALNENFGQDQQGLYKDLPKDIREEMLSDEFQKQVRQSILDVHYEKTREDVMEYCQSLPMLKMLVGEFRADIDYVDPSGYWPLSSFAEDDDMETVKWLLENNAKPNNTSTGATAIYKAIQNDNLEMVKLFLKHGASLDVVDVDMCGPFLGCESVKMAELLIQSGGDLTVRDQAGFPTWYFVDDEKAKAYLEKEARKRGSR
ncbi:MAG: hypothetical protein ACJAR1_001075 [Rubritalea sp.]|jgi:hypothetical protein